MTQTPGKHLLFNAHAQQIFPKYVVITVFAKNIIVKIILNDTPAKINLLSDVSTTVRFSIIFTMSLPSHSGFFRNIIIHVYTHCRLFLKLKRLFHHSNEDFLVTIVELEILYYKHKINICKSVSFCPNIELKMSCTWHVCLKKNFFLFFCTWCLI